MAIRKGRGSEEGRRPRLAWLDAPHRAVMDPDAETPFDLLPWR